MVAIRRASEGVTTGFSAVNLQPNNTSYAHGRHMHKLGIKVRCLLAADSGLEGRRDLQVGKFLPLNTGEERVALNVALAVHTAAQAVSDVTSQELYCTVTIH